MKFKIFIFLLLFALSSCEKNLKPVIYDRLSSTNFPVTEADASVFVTGIYGEFRGTGAWNRYSIDPESRLMMGEYGTEECFINWDWCNLPQLNFDFNPNYGIWATFYNNMVPAVTKATAAIAQLKTVSFTDKNLQTRLIAEVKGIRAMWMYDLEGFFGPPQVVLDEKAALNPQELYYPPRLSEDEYLKFMETDLLDIINVLPTNQVQYGRFTKGAAMTMLLKFYMRHKQWEKAAGISAQIIALGKYQLLTNYKDIWNVDANTETIFALPCIALPSPNSNIIRPHVLPPDYVSPTGGKVTAWSGYRVPWSTWDSFDPDDIRRSVLVKDYYVNLNGVTTLVDGRATNRLPTGALPLKYGEDPASDGLFAGNDLVILRYADVLLLRAEALNKLNGPNAESIALINQIRNRAFNNNAVKRIKLSDFTNTDSLNDYLLKERLWEFCFEGERREDLIRHGKYIQYARNRGKNAQDYQVRYPIPYGAIIEGKGKIIQNSGY